MIADYLTPELREKLKGVKSEDLVSVVCSHHPNLDIVRACAVAAAFERDCELDQKFRDAVDKVIEEKA